MTPSLPEWGCGSAARRARASQYGDPLGSDLNRALLQRHDEMSQPGEAGGVMVRMIADLAFEVHDPLALLNLPCPQQAGEPREYRR